MATLASMMVRLGIDTDDLRAGASRASSALSSIGKAVGALGAGAPAVAAVGTAAGGMAAAFASAGAAVKAYQLAVGPQMQAITEVSDLAAEAEEAAASGAEDAAEKQAEYQQALNDLTPATRAAAVQFIGLKDDYEDWSNALSDTTMPVFTKGLKLIRQLLPSLTPLVQAAAGALSGFVDEIAAATSGGGVQRFAESLASVAETNLSAFLTSAKNVLIGLVGVIQAFLPYSDSMSGGIVEASEAFAQWGQSLEGSEGFAEFIELAKQGGETLGTLAQTALTLLVSLAPLIGVSAQLALVLARIINALPPAAVTALSSAILVTVAAMRVYSAYTAVASAASSFLATRLGQQVVAWLRLRAQSVAAMARTAAAATANAARTAAAWAAAAARATATWLATIIRVAATSIAQFVMMAARAVVWAATMAAQWLIAMGPVGWITAAVIALVALIIANWDTIKSATVAAWNWIWAKIKQFAGFIWNLFLNWTIYGLVIKHWDKIKAGTARVWNAVVAWVRKIPGRLLSFFMNWTIYGQFIKHWDQIKTGTIRRASALVTWVRGLPGRISRGIGSLGDLLYDKGQDIIRGLWRGIKSMGSWLSDVVEGWLDSSIVGTVTSALGIGSPSKVMADEAGQWIPAGIAEGVEDNLGGLRAAAQAAADAAIPTASVSGMSGVSGGGAYIVLEFTGPRELLKVINKNSRTRGGSTAGVTGRG